MRKICRYGNWCWDDSREGIVIGGDECKMIQPLGMLSAWTQTLAQLKAWASTKVTLLSYGQLFKTLRNTYCRWRSQAYRRHIDIDQKMTWTSRLQTGKIHPTWECRCPSTCMAEDSLHMKLQALWQGLLCWENMGVKCQPGMITLCILWHTRPIWTLSPTCANPYPVQQVWVCAGRGKGCPGLPEGYPW